MPKELLLQLLPLCTCGMQLHYAAWIICDTGFVTLVMTLWLSPKTYDGSSTGTPIIITCIRLHNSSPLLLLKQQTQIQKCLIPQSPDAWVPFNSSAIQKHSYSSCWSTCCHACGMRCITVDVDLHILASWLGCMRQDQFCSIWLEFFPLGIFMPIYVTPLAICRVKDNLWI